LTATDDFSGVNETFYRVNGAAVQNVSGAGQPIIASEDGNNTLEYWSVDNFGHEETHHFLTGIKSDKTVPVGSVAIENGMLYKNSTSVELNLTAADSVSGVQAVRLSNDGVWDTEQWESFSPTKSWTLTSGDGVKTVYFQIRDKAGLLSSTYYSSILLDTTPPFVKTPLRDPSGDIQPGQPASISVNVTDSESGLQSVRLTYFTNKSAAELELPMIFNQTSGLYECTFTVHEAATLVSYEITAYDGAGNGATNDNAGQCYVYTVVPECPSFVSLSAFMMAVSIGFIAAIVYRRRHSHPNEKLPISVGER
jgi:hypothetical protein